MQERILEPKTLVVSNKLMFKSLLRFQLIPTKYASLQLQKQLKILTAGKFSLCVRLKLFSIEQKKFWVGNMTIIFVNIF
jgi:hypothetical protein